MNFTTWGANSSFGILLAFFLDNERFPGATPTDYALVGGLIMFFTLGLTAHTAVLLEKLGYRVTVSIGIGIQVAAYIGASFSESIGILYLTQGMLMGISYGIIFGANSIILPMWFLEKRALANGITHSGIGMGGVVFSLAVNKLLSETGDQKWPLRMLCIVSFVVCTCCMLFVRERTSRVKTPIRVVWTRSFNVRVWKMKHLKLISLWGSLASVGYVVMLYSMSDYAISVGLSSADATIITTCLNAGQMVGRPLIGLFSEKYGRVNVTMLSTLYCCVLCLAFWIEATSFPTLVAFALMLGLCVGVGSVNVVPLVSDVVEEECFAAGLGFAYFFLAIFSLVAEVIALYLRDPSKGRPYIHCQILVGFVYFVSFISLIPLREWKVRRLSEGDNLAGPGLINYLKRCTLMRKL